MSKPQKVFRQLKIMYIFLQYSNFLQNRTYWSYFVLPTFAWINICYIVYLSKSANFPQSSYSDYAEHRLRDWNFVTFQIFIMWGTRLYMKLKSYTGCVYLYINILIYSETHQKKLFDTTQSEVKERCLGFSLSTSLM